MKLYVDDKKCVPCGVCENIAPKIFKLTIIAPTMHTITLNPDEAKQDLDRFLCCVEACPMQCIKMEA